MPAWVVYSLCAAVLAWFVFFMVRDWRRAIKRRDEQVTKWRAMEAALRRDMTRPASSAAAAANPANVGYAGARAAVKSPVSRGSAYASPAVSSGETSTDDGFVTSMTAAALSDDVGVGYAVGGNLAGALLGEALRPDPEPCRSPDPEPCRSESSSSCDSSSSYDSSSSSSSDSSSSSSSWSE